ncbi:hypothetical protein B296_00027135 [Ensete ventricosum]|uniref:Uncharacterized protein n=1 Tax=Ensete ventricosum TaxID=4639 RepID=A0A426Y9X6_ENSVE|nr:hypothetical protein B296_00027135 [Ensete ventricosum]
MHRASPALMMSSRASSVASGGCALTSLMLSMQWSPGPSSLSWAFLFLPPHILSSLCLPPTMLTTWWSSSSSPLPLAFPTHYACVCPLLWPPPLSLPRLDRSFF